MDELLHGAGDRARLRDRGRDRRAGPGPRAVARDGRRRPGRRRPLPQRRHGQPRVRRARVRQGGVDRGVRYVPETTVTRVLPRRRRPLGDRSSSPRAARSRPRPWSSRAACGPRSWRGSPARDVALFPAEHVWVMTDETDLASETKPFVRDLDGFLYVRHYRGRLVIGAFEPNGRPLPPARVPVDGVRGARAGLGPLRAGARPGAPADPGPRLARVRALPPRARVLHARRQPAARPRPRGPGAVRRGGPQLAGDHLRAGRRAGGRRVDPRRPPDDGPRRGRRRAHGFVGHAAAVAAGADGRVAGQPVRHALAGEAADDRARPAPAAAPRRAPGGRRGVRAGGRLGAPAVVRAGRPRAARSATTTSPRRGSTPSARRSARPAPASPCTT